MTAETQTHRDSLPPVNTGFARFAIRLAVSGGILTLILLNIEIDQVVSAWQDVDGVLLVWGVVLQFCSSSLAAFRWHLLMRNLQFGQSPVFYWRAYFKGLFFNQGLPTSIGGDAVRALDVARRGFRKRDAAYAVVVDRVVGLSALLMLNLLAYLLAPTLLPIEVFYVTFIATVLVVIGFFIAWRLAELRNQYGNPILANLKYLSVRLRSAFSAHTMLISTSSLMVHVLALLSLYMIGSSLQLDLELLAYFVVVPPALLLTVVPVSIAGWGVREGALVALFALAGSDTATALAMSITYGLLLILVSLPGFAIYLRERHRVL